MEKLRYNFVFLFARYDFWRNILGEELYNNKNVRIYKEGFSCSRIIEKIFHYHWAFSINKKICLPFKRIWFKKMYSQDFNNDLPIVFVYLGGGTIYYGKEFFEYVKKKNPKNKNVMLYQDLVSKCLEKEHFLLKNLVDMEITYDSYEASKYGMEYFQETTFSKTIPEPEEVCFKYDVYFLASAKDRLSKIHEAYRYFTENGLRCKFIVTGVPKEKQIDGIEYCDGISYDKNIQYVLESKCLLEIIQGGSRDITTRALEAIAYRRKFISDCEVELSEFFHGNQVYRYKNAKDIDIKFAKADYKPEEYNPVFDYNPLKRLYFIQDKLEALDEK